MPPAASVTAGAGEPVVRLPGQWQDDAAEANPGAEGLAGAACGCVGQRHG